MGFKDLTVCINDVSKVNLRFQQNSYYFRYDNIDPVLDGGDPRWRYVGYGLLVIGLVVLLGFWGGMGWIALTNSSAMIETTGTIHSVNSSPGKITVRYSYNVDSVHYEHTQDSRFAESGWRNGDTPHPVRYLSFQPSVALLPENIEKLDTGLLVFGTLFLGSFPIGGYFVLRQLRRMERLRRGATHLLEGTVEATMHLQKGNITIFYTAISPHSNLPIKGSIDIGKFESVRNQLQKGAKVAILYHDDRLHTML